MKVAVIGASGNTGTALLRELQNESAISEILGIARRRPEVGRPPYGGARWEVFDIAVPTRNEQDRELIVERLAELLRGVDTVVHLAWLIQPIHDRELLRRANVAGTARVIEASVRAGVRHLVVASSVGAYSPVDDDRRRDESWPTDGTADGSHYAVDKAAQERLLDDAETAHPSLLITRLRPALVFHAAAGAEILRYFLGALVPGRALRPGALPVLPVPAGLRLQVVHAADLADAYRRVIMERPGGAFNIASEPVLRGPELAEVVSGGRFVEVPPSALRPLLSLAWRSRAIAADPGWLDLAMAAPLLDTDRARQDLGWVPRVSTDSALAELLDGIAEGSGAGSPPMRPLQDWPTDQVPPGSLAPSGITGPDSQSSAHRVPPYLERDVLGLYLSDHLTGATAGVARIERMASAYRDTEHGADLARIAAEIGEEREFLASLIDTLELRRRPYRQAVAAAGEIAGRLKLNGQLTESPMTPLLEVELMRSAVVGKLGGWQTMARLAPDLGIPVELFEGLAAQSRGQIDTLGRLHDGLIDQAFRDGEIS